MRLTNYYLGCILKLENRVHAQLWALASFCVLCFAGWVEPRFPGLCAVSAYCDEYNNKQQQHMQYVQRWNISHIGHIIHLRIDPSLPLFGAVQDLSAMDRSSAGSICYSRSSRLYGSHPQHELDHTDQEDVNDLDHDLSVDDLYLICLRCVNIYTVDPSNARCGAS